MKRALLRKDVAARFSQRSMSQTIKSLGSKLAADNPLAVTKRRLTTKAISSRTIIHGLYDQQWKWMHKRSLAIISGAQGSPSPTPLFVDEDDGEDDFDESSFNQQYEPEDDEEHHYPLTGPNPGLASIIAQGSKTLETTAADIEYRTRNASLEQPHKKGSFRAGTLEPRQLAEGQRILDTALEALESILEQSERGSLSDGQRKGLILGGEPIVLLECVVNRNVKQAKLYWTLPYGILMDERIHYHQQKLYKELTNKVQQQLVEGGGAKLLARHVHAKLSSYYPPRIKMMPATDDMVIKAIEEYNMI